MKIESLRTRALLAGAALLALGSVPAKADYSGTVLGYNPLAYWRFDEAASSPALNKVANTSTLGSAGDGYLILNATNGQPGIVGNCIQFTHAGTDVGLCDSKVDVPWNAALNPKPPLTVEFWAKPNSFGADATGYCPLSNFDPNWYGGGNRSGWLFYLNNAGRWNFRLGVTSGYAVNLTATSGNATVGQWQHMVATYDGATAKLYANGVLIGTATGTGWSPNPESFIRFGGTPLTGTGALAPLTSCPINTAANTFSILSNNGNRGYDGWLDEVAIYPIVLSQATIAAHFAAATTNNAGYHAQVLADGPVGYWPMDEPYYAPPDPSTYPTVANSGSLGSEADGVAQWGVLTGQSGSGYAGLGAGNAACLLDGHNGYVQVKDATGLHFTGNFTLMAWVKPTEKDFFRNILSHGFKTTVSVLSDVAETSLRITRGGTAADGNAGDGNYYEIFSYDGSTSEYVRSAVPAGDIGNWVFLAATFDGGALNLYRNGQLVGATTGGSLIGMVDVTNRWCIGSRSDPGRGQGQYFGGAIDEPAIFNTALGASDINTIYNAAQVSPVITRGLQNPGTVYKGASLTLSVWAEGSPTLSYSWTSNGVPTGVTTTNITLNNLSAGTTTIAVTVANPYGTNTSSVTFPVVAQAPSISQQPQPVWRFNGYPFTLSTTAGGSAPLNYYWMQGSTVVQAGPSATYNATAGPATAGTYSCLVSNEAGTLLSSNATVTVVPVPAGYPSVVLGSSPISYWRLDETSGTAAHDLIAGNDGVYHNTTLAQPGYSVFDLDKAVTFAGANSYVGSISGTAINFSGHRSFSLEAWVNGPAGLADQSTIIAKGIGNNGTTETEQFALDVSGGNFRFFATLGGTVYAATAPSGPDGNWHHVVGVYDDAGGKMYIYVDGLVAGNGPTIANGLNNTATPVSIGSKRTGNDPNYDGTFAGTVDEVAIYGIALSADTVLLHYSTTFDPTSKPFISVQPSPLTNYITLQAAFSVTAGGPPPLSYQWHFGSTDLVDDGIHILGSQTRALAINGLVSGDAGNYSVTIANGNGSTNSATVQLTVLPTPAANLPIPGLVAHLPFDGSLSDVSGRANSGSGKHSYTNYPGGSGATVPASPTPANPDFTYVSDGVVGQGLHYATLAINTGGTTSLGTNSYYVSLGTPPDLLFSSSVNFSVAFWVRLPANYIGGDLPFFTDAVGSLGNKGYVFAPAYGYGTADPNPSPAPLNYGGWAYSVYDSAGVGARIYGALGSIDDGNWHSLVHVFNRNGGTASVYLDGLLAQQSLSSGTSAGAAGNIDAAPPNPATIGQDPTGFYGETGSADIDELMVFRKALTPVEAASIYMLGKGGFTAVPAPVQLTIVRLPTGQVQLNWPAGIPLQAADQVTGPWTLVTGAAPPYTAAPSAASKFYRLIY